LFCFTIKEKIQVPIVNSSTELFIERTVSSILIKRAKLYYPFCINYERRTLLYEKTFFDFRFNFSISNIWCKTQI